MWGKSFCRITTRALPHTIHAYTHTHTHTHTHVDIHTVHTTHRNCLPMFVKRPVKTKKSWAGFWIQTEWGGFADWQAKHSHSRKMVQWNLKRADQKISKCILGFAKASHLRNGRCMIYELLIYRMHVLVCISGKERGSNLQVEPSGSRFQTFWHCDALNSISRHKSLSVSVWLIVLFICIVYIQPSFILCL